MDMKDTQLHITDVHVGLLDKVDTGNSQTSPFSTWRLFYFVYL